MTSQGVRLERPVQPGTGTVLATKLARPRVPPTFVQRQPLTALLDHGSSRQLTLVSAGAGWGKTLVAADWASDPIASHISAWLSLDEGDNSPGRFWSGVLGALRIANAVPDDSPLATLSPLLGSPDDIFDRVLHGLVDLPAPVLLVLDDFHLIQDPVVLHQTSELLRQRLTTLHLVVLTRFDPALPTHRLRLDDELVEIRARDLAFAADDATALLNAHQIQLRPGEAARLVERTEGWAAGLRLAGLFLERSDLGRDVDEFTGTERVVSAYLADEVLAGLSSDMREFLLRTSVADRLNGDLAAVLSGQPQAQQRLESLEASNAFVVGLGTDRQWFRFHALLREMLLHRLQVDSPESLPALHTLAAHWYATHDQPVDALHHAAEACDWTLFGDIFVAQGCVSLLVAPARDEIGRALRRIPADQLRTTINLVMCAASLCYLDRRVPEMAELVGLAEAMLGEPSTETHPATILTLSMLSCTVARGVGDMSRLLGSAATILHEVNGAGLPASSAAAFRTVALGGEGTAFFWSGEFDPARRRLNEAVEVGDRFGVELAALNARAHLALAAAIDGRLTDASEIGTTVVDLVDSRGWGLLPQSATAFAALTIVALERLGLVRARELVGLCREASAYEPVAHHAAGLLDVRLLLAEGHRETAHERFESLEAGSAHTPTARLLTRWVEITRAELALALGNPGRPDLAPGSSDDDPFAAKADLLLAQAALQAGDPDGAEAYLAPLRTATPAGGRVDVWVLSALTASRRREDARAASYLDRALALAQEEGGSWLPFMVADSEPLVRLLTQARELGTDPVLVDDLLGRLGGLDPHEEALPYEALTDRELSVLQYLPTMMTNVEIAERLFISVNTVKAHLKSIFRKLGVTSRRQAVERARELGLNDSHRSSR